MTDTPNNSLGPAAASSNVSWQVDIPNLANLLVRIGAEGLKKLQSCGLDIHTVGCLLALGEITPASVTFRTELQRARQDERSQRWWFYNVVEYGSGTNFAVDVLLKTRAGENVLALLSAIVSVLEDEAAEVLSLLFEKLNMPPHSTPSISQLESLRSICLPLARKLEFKDRLAEAHQHLLHEFEVTTLGFFNASEAVPDSETMAELVKKLKDISMQRNQQTLKLFFYGTRGAAWLAVYASKVLDLALCFMRKDGTPCQMGSSYGSAHVVLFPESYQKPSELFKVVERPSEVVVLAARERDVSVNWLVSCGEGGVDILGLYCGWALRDRQEVGDLVYSIACEYTERRTRIPIRGNRNHQSFFEQGLDGQLRSLQQILHLLGFPQQLHRKINWRDEHFQAVIRAGKKSIEIKLKLFSTMLEHVDEPIYELCSHAKVQPNEMNQLPTLCVRCALYNVVRYISFISSCLLFTDWARSFKKISIQSLPIGREFLAQRALKYFEEIYDTPKDFETPELDRNYVSGKNPSLRGDLGAEICQICCGSPYGLNLIDSNSESFLGANLDGVLLIDFRALEPSLRAGPIFMLREGDFRLGEERRPLLITPSSGGSSYSDPDMPFESIMPSDHFKGASLSVSASLSKAAIQLRYTFIFEDLESTSGDFRGLEVDVPVASVLPGLEFMQTTIPCSHSFHEPLVVSKVVQGWDSYWKDNSGTLWSTQHQRQGGNKSKLPQNYMRLHSVLNNSLAQWAFLAESENKRQLTSINKSNVFREPVFLLQQQTCLSCTRDQALVLCGFNERDMSVHIFCSGIP